MLGSAIKPPWQQAFVDSNAQWIWTIKGANIDAPANYLPIKFKKTYSSSTALAVTIHAYADNYAHFTLNGRDLGWSYWGAWGQSQWQTTLQAGNNVIAVDAFNVDGPAGVLLTAVNSATGAVLFHTDASWTWQIETNQ